MIDCVPIGTAIVAYIEPHEGQARAFNRWYERDHFYAATMAGPGAFAGARYVATRACKAVRPESGTRFGDPTRGSYLAAYWLLPDTQPDWDSWAIAQMKDLTAQDRLFPGRDHLHTAVYHYEFEERIDGGPFAALALDRDYAGVVAIAIEGNDLEGARAWCARLARPEIPVTAAFTQQRLIMSVLSDTTDSDDHVLVIAFIDGDVLAVWRDHVEPLLADVRVGFASPFLRTIPGTDAYVDEL